MSVTDEKGPRKFLRLRRRWNGPGHESAQWPAPRPPVTDPRAILDANREQDLLAGRYDIKKVKTRRGRRVWDFLQLFVLGNGAGTAFMWLAEADTATVLIVTAAMVFYTLALAWVMFVHLDEY